MIYLNKMKNYLNLKSIWTTLIRWKQGLCPELFWWHLSYFLLAQLGLQSNHLQYVSFGTIHILHTGLWFSVQLIILPTQPKYDNWFFVGLFIFLQIFPYIVSNSKPKLSHLGPKLVPKFKCLKNKQSLEISVNQ